MTTTAHIGSGPISMTEVDEPVGELFGRMRLYRIFRISENTNSFGLRGVCMMRRNGEAWEVGMSDFRLSGLKNGDVVRVPQMHTPNAQPCFAGFAEIPRRMQPDPPAEVVAMIWKGATVDDIKNT